MCLTLASPVLSRIPLAAVASNSSTMPNDSPRSSHTRSLSRAPLHGQLRITRFQLSSLQSQLVSLTMLLCNGDIDPSDVLLRALRHPAQSALVLTVISLTSTCMAYFQTSLGCIFKYLPVRRRRRREPVVGLLISLQPSLIANTQSGRSAAM